MTTDRDTLREKLREYREDYARAERLLERGNVSVGDCKKLEMVADDRVLDYIDAHDNALKKQTEADILGRLPASSRTCTCTTCRVVTGKLNQVFNKGETDE